MSPVTAVIERHGEIAVLILDKPPVNAVDLDLVRDAEACLKGVEGDESVRGLVITGRGKCFCAGLDLKTVPYYSQSEQRRIVEELNRTVAWLYGFPVPTVAAVNGHAIAGGFILALACDYRVGTESPCLLGVTESRMGIPFPVSTMEVLRAELSPAGARRMTLVGRNLGPREALSAGVLDELQSPDRIMARAGEMALDLGSMPREAYGRIKRQLRGEALTRMDEAIRTGNDPLLKMWIADEGRSASAGHLGLERD
ncbi:MAG: enoyl-CoA hydratase/isomerase family protein [Proteobacteria bacterium]|nr:enoyl-CoA hydratase/isomerase family protein [Pseudomonadota bacterium]